MAAPGGDRVGRHNIRKFEEIGTSPAAPKAAINDALLFHQAIGAERKAARLRYLTMRWANRLKNVPQIKIHSSLEPGQTWGMCMVGISGMVPPALSSLLWDRYRIIVAAINGGVARSALRVSGRPRDAEHPHDAGRDRHVHQRDGRAGEVGRGRQ